MNEDARRRSQFKREADRIFKSVIEPRMSVVAREFPNTTYTGDAATSVGSLRFNADGRYLARVEMCIGVSLEIDDRIAIYVRPKIIPLLIEGPHEERITMRLSAIDDNVAARFVEQQLEPFLITYSSMETVPGYQELNRVVDPVCGMEISRIDAAERTHYMGRTYYSCVPECRETFLADPLRYAARAEE